MRSARVALAAALAALVAAGITACGIPVDDTPEPVEIPARYRSTPPTSDGPEIATSGGLNVTLCLTTREGRLVEHVRTVETPRSPQQLLADLIAGPTDRESEDLGLSSALTGIRVISIAGISGGIVEVAVGDLEGITATSQQLIFAQIVCTIDALDSVVGVRFTQDGQPLPVPRADATSAEVVTAADYAPLLDASPTTSPSP
jgi:spore germination protein GerM